MDRRRFLGLLGGASGSALAGCAEFELESDVAAESPDEQIRFLQRQRAVLLYAGGVVLVTQGGRAARDASAALKARQGVTAQGVFHGRASGYYDSAAWNFARAGVILYNLDVLGAQLGVDACEDASARAYHLGMGNVYRARALVEAEVGDVWSTDPSSSLDDGGGVATPTADPNAMQPAGTMADDDDGGMQQAGTMADDDPNAMQPAGTMADDDDGGMQGMAPPDDASTTGDSAKKLAVAHFDRAREYQILSVEQLREGLGLAGG